LPGVPQDPDVSTVAIMRMALWMVLVAVGAIVGLVLLSAWPPLAGTAAAAVGQVAIVVGAICGMVGIGVGFSRRK
jgi:hypothetical protein